MEVPVRQSVATQVVSVVATVAITAFGLWAGLALVGESAQLDIGTLVVTAGALLVVELALRPILRRLAGHGSALLALVIGLAAQVFTAWLVAAVILGIRIQHWSNVLVVLGTMAVITAVGRWLVGASDAAYIVGHTLRRRPRGHSASAPGWGLVIVQLDGVSADVMRRAMASGQAPTISRWLRDETHVLREWWVPVPSTTPASQAAILHGDDTQVPGFRWWDRELDRLMVSNRPADAAQVETRFGAGRGLLRQGGVAVSTAFTGEADEAFLVFSRATGRRGLGSGSSFIPLFASPFLLPRTLLLTVGEMVKEVYQARRQKVRGIEPRIPRRFSYVALRGVTNVFLRTLNLVVVTDAMSRGAPVIFADFVDYDEIAHHAGSERPEAMRALEGLDAVLDELERASHRVPTEYELVVWSDHGQSLGPTFEQLFGSTLADRVQHLMADDALRSLESANGDDWGPLNALLTSTFARTNKQIRGIELGPDRGHGRPEADERPHVVVVGGGNLGMVWFPHLSTRPTLEQVSSRWPGLVPGLALTEGVAAIMVASDDGGAVVVGAHGVHRLDTDEVSGLAPLAPYDARAAADLRRLSTMENCGDLMLLSTVDAEGTVHAFEGLVGSHGGIGGFQNHGLLLHPIALDVDPDLMSPSDGAPIFTSAVAIHDQIERWRRRQGTLVDEP